MATKTALLRSHTLLPKLLLPLRLISTSPSLSQQPQPSLEPQPSSTPLPPNPSTGSPFYHENWRNPTPTASSASHLLPASGQSAAAARLMTFSKTPDLAGLLNLFADWVTHQRWDDIKSLFEYWVRSLDVNGKPNKPDVNLFNHYLRARLMQGSPAQELLDLVDEMKDFEVSPNSASYNLVLKAMFEQKAIDTITMMISSMLKHGPAPDDETFNLVVDLFIKNKHVDLALQYLDIMLKSGHQLTFPVYMNCLNQCLDSNKLDLVASIIEKCKASEKNKLLCPRYPTCYSLLDTAVQSENARLAHLALQLVARWILHGEHAKPPVFLPVDEGLMMSAYVTAGRAHNANLLNDVSQVLKRSLRGKKVPNPETYLAKIFAYANLGELAKAFMTLSEMEMAYGDSEVVDEEMFSPFMSLNPLVVACCKDGFKTLDTVYVQLEKMSQGEKPYKSVAALNCVILGCANIWDLERAYETFEAIKDKIGLTPDIHSYNALLCAFGRVKKTAEACNVFEHLVSIGVKPNATTYSQLVDAHLINRDQNSALNVINDMVEAGFSPTKEMLKKVRRRCSRLMDFNSNDKVQALARKFNIRMGNEIRREMLFKLEYSSQF
ncbi:hypothetical protein LUZ60_006483 [Juncus effusus]|nr:hypothetical protein LUZ60_006483 [Juncus effusus]